MVGLPDPDKSFALLIGVSEFAEPEYHELLNCRKSIEALERLLTDPDGNMWQLPRERVKVLPGQVSANEARFALADIESRNDFDSLLVCVSTHGRRFDQDLGSPDLHLAMSDSRFDTPGSHWHFGEIRLALQRMRRDRRADILLIVDTCYTQDLAVGPKRGMSGGQHEPLRLTVPRVTVLSATRESREAWPHWPRRAADGTWQDSGYTAFLGALIDTIEEGVPCLPRILTVGHVFDEAVRRLDEARKREREIPEPNKNTDGSGDMALCRNRCEPPADPPDGEVAGHRPLTADACFELLQLLPDKRHEALLKDFCQGKDVAIAQVAALVPKLEANELPGCLENVYGSVCAVWPPADIALFAHALHEVGSRPDEQRIVASIRAAERSARVIGAVHLSMHESGCDDCRSGAEVMADLIVADDALLNVLLGVWRNDDADGAAQ